MGSVRKDRDKVFAQKAMSTLRDVGFQGLHGGMKNARCAFSDVVLRGRRDQYTIQHRKKVLSEYVTRLDMGVKTGITEQDDFI